MQYSSPARLHTLKWLLISLVMSILNPWNVLAQTNDLYLAPENVSLSDDTVVHGQAVRIYATVGNSSTNDLLGSVQFVNETTGATIGSDQAVSVIAQGTDTVFVDWKGEAGTHTIRVTVYPWENEGDDTGNNTVRFTTTVDYDYDGDGVGNAQDPNDDNDDTPDTEDAFPYDNSESKDTDGDGIGDNADPDNDNDGILDETDQMPENPNESSDADADGVGDNADTDDDNDGISDETETQETQTDPLKPDTDGDGYNDGEDAFPLDEKEWIDTDGDGIGNQADPNDDNDDLNDNEDSQPENHGPVIHIERYEETDAKTGEKFIVFDASETTDPDGDNGQLHFWWMSKDGRLIGEKAVLKLKVPLKNLMPSSLTVEDDDGETREYALSPNALNYFKLMAKVLAFCLLVVLALLLSLKYAASAKTSKKVKKS